MEVIKVKWGHKDGVVIPQDYYPYKKKHKSAGCPSLSLSTLSAP